MSHIRPKDIRPESQPRVPESENHAHPETQRSQHPASRINHLERHFRLGMRTLQVPPLPRNPSSTDLRQHPAQAAIRCNSVPASPDESVPEDLAGHPLSFSPEQICMGETVLKVKVPPVRIENSLSPLYRGTDFSTLAKTFQTVWGGLLRPHWKPLTLQF